MVRLEARRGALAGALAAVWLAFADYGATWLWLPLVRDRAQLIVRLLALLVPVGALLGALLATLFVLASRRLAEHPRRDWLLPLPFVVLSLAPSWWLAGKLCEGGMMSRLAQRWPLASALTVLLPSALYVALALAHSATRYALARPTRVLPYAVLWLVAATLASKANQLILPNLYDYLHGALALGAWLAALVGLALALFHVPRFARAKSALDRRWVGGALALICGAVALWNARTLEQNLNVRVAMFDARSPTSRAVLASAEPLLRRFEPARSMEAPQVLVRPRGDTSALPSAPGAHVLLVTIDALRADHLGAYGYARPVSPKLDALAANALLFERAYAQAPHSSYSLSSLHTSEYLHETVELGQPLPSATLATTLHGHGYHTAAFFTSGIFHTEGHKLSALRDSAFGFALFDQTDRESEQQTDRVLAEVDRLKQRGEPSTLFWVHYFDVHEPYQETTFGTSEMDRYDSEIAHVDRELDRLITTMRARLTRPLAIVISADHGEEFRDHGGVYHGSTLYDEQVRVPLIVQIPGYAPERIAAPVEVIDIAPTILGAVGAPVPVSMRGRDLRALSRQGGPTPALPVFSAVLTKRMALLWPHKLISDLRFGLFELYDLERDPDERRNLASEQPERLAALRGLIYAWLDSLEPELEPNASPAAGWQRALALGRLGDRRAVEPMAELLLDHSAPDALRKEAGQILAKLADPRSVDALLAGLATEPSEVAAEAAIALGRMYDERARDALQKLMHAEDPYLRARAAVSLGRLRDRQAVPALIDALWVAPTQYEREEAVRWLGRLRDPSAVEPLLSLLPEFSLRYLIAVALGQIGDARAYDALVDMLTWESRTNIRDEIARGLGLLGDARAIPVLVMLLDREPGLRNTAEALVRLGAHVQGQLGGLDVAPQIKGLTGLGGCVAGPLDHDWDFTQRTHCTTQGRRAQLELPLPSTRTHWLAAQLVIRARRADAPEPTSCAVSLARSPLGNTRFDGSFREQRWDVAGDQLRAAHASLVLECDDKSARITLDHALIVPRTDSTASLSNTEEPEQATP